MIKRYEIWKLQRPIVSNEPSHLLAYTEDKVKMAQIPLSEEMLDEIFGDEFKVYAMARVVNGVLKVKYLVEEQAW